MTYRITLAHPCGTLQVVSSLSEAYLLVRMGWRFIGMRGRHFTMDNAGPVVERC